LLQDGNDRHEKCRNITKEHIYLFLKETGCSKHYEDIVLIHYMLTGKSRMIFLH